MNWRAFLAGLVLGTLAARHGAHAYSSDLRPFVLLRSFINGRVPF